MPETSFTHRKPRFWQKVSITIPETYSDILSSYLAELTSSAVEQSTTLIETPTSNDTVSVYLEEGPLLQDYTQQIQDFLTTLNLQEEFSYTIDSEQVIEEDWNKRWKDHFKPFNLTKRLVVKPSWEEYTPIADEVVLEMDPGMAFGTGLHASTRLALQLTETLFNEKPINTVLDVGTGTGILGMSCALFGATKIVGIDNDIDARVAAVENIRQNKLENKMSIINKDLYEIEDTFDLVIANITQDVLTLLSKDLKDSLNPGGNLILSGILTGDQAKNIERTFSNLGLSKHASKLSEEWTAFHFTTT